MRTPGIQIAISTTGYWTAAGADRPLSGREKGAPSDFKGTVCVGRDPDDDEYFTATLASGPSLTSPEIVYRGRSLADAVRAMNERLERFERQGATPGDRDDDPAHVSLKEAEHNLESARRHIDDYLAGLSPQPPAPVEIVTCNASELKDALPLFTIPRGTLFLASFGGRAAIFVTATEMTDWVETTREELPKGRARVYVFPTPEDRWTHIARRGWDRLRDGYLRDEMRAQYTILALGRGSEQDFESAYEDAREAIRELPCKRCGQIHWPVVAKPERESAEWWWDPSEYFACRNCEELLADAFAYPKTRWTSTKYPFEGRGRPPPNATRSPTPVHGRGDEVPG